MFLALLTPFNPNEIDAANPFLAPSAMHPLGTDSVGRDLLARILYGARMDLLMAVTGVAGPFVLGTAIGLLAGYSGGWLDAVLTCRAPRRTRQTPSGPGFTV